MPVFAKRAVYYLQTTLLGWYITILSMHTYTYVYVNKCTHTHTHSIYIYINTNNIYIYTFAISSWLSSPWISICILSWCLVICVSDSHLITKWYINITEWVLWCYSLDAEPSSDIPLSTIIAVSCSCVALVVILAVVLVVLCCRRRRQLLQSK